MKMIAPHSTHQIHIFHMNPESNYNLAYTHTRNHCIFDFHDNLDDIFLSEIHILNLQYIDHIFHLYGNNPTYKHTNDH